MYEAGVDLPIVLPLHRMLLINQALRVTVPGHVIHYHVGHLIALDLI